MERLPIKFEEILKEHDMWWFKDCYKAEDMQREHYFVTPYEIAGIGLEAMCQQNIQNKREVRFSFDNCGYTIEIENKLTRNMNAHETYFIEDKDFCECVNRAIIEIYGTKEEKDAFNKKL